MQAENGFYLFGFIEVSLPSNGWRILGPNPTWEEAVQTLFSAEKALPLVVNDFKVKHNNLIHIFLDF